MKKSLLLLGLLAAFNANANLIKNGGFEDYTVGDSAGIHVSLSGSGGCGTLSPGVTCVAQNLALYDWAPIVNAPNEFLEVRNNFVGAAIEGIKFAELNPSALSGIIQTFTAQAGLGTLSWLDKGREGQNYSYNVLLNGTSILTGSSTATTTFGTNDWVSRNFSGLNLLQGDNTLSFVSLSTSHLGAQIDNISLVQSSVTTAVPEPETYGMMMMGLAILGFASRRRKQ